MAERIRGRGVALDYDGVLVQSMERHAEAYRRVLEPHGVQPTDADIFRMEGGRSETIITDLLTKAGNKKPEKELVDKLSAEKQALFAGMGPSPMYPGAENLVRALARSPCRIGLVTGTRRENLEASIPTLLPLFHAVLAQNAYNHDKPHPEPYTKTADALGIVPAQCAALENAVRGVQSAKRAGFRRIIAITTTMKETELRAAGADRIVTRHEDALKALLEWTTAP